MPDRIPWTKLTDRAAELIAAGGNPVAVADRLARDTGLGITYTKMRRALLRAGLSVTQIRAHQPSTQGASPSGGASSSEGSAIVRPGRLVYAVTLTDIHWPYTDLKVWATQLAIIREVKPKWGQNLGDFGDLESLSDHPKQRVSISGLKADYKAMNLALDAKQNASPDTEWVYVEGNHEFRAYRKMCEQGSLDGLLNVPQQLYMEADEYALSRGVQLRKMRYVGIHDQPCITPWAAFYHGHLCRAKHHAYWHAVNYVPARCPGLVLFYGHRHAFQQATAETGGVAQAIGWGGLTREAKYTMGHPSGWEHGLTIHEINLDTMAASYTPVRIVNGKAHFGGQVYMPRIGARERP